MSNPSIQVTDLESTFHAIKNSNPQELSKHRIPHTPDYKSIPDQNYAPSSTVSGAFGGGMNRYASSGAGIIYGQPTFFSPVHTPINWQIPSKRLEQYQWARFFYENEPKVASAIDFYSYFPMNDYEHECKDRNVKKHFDKMKKRLKMSKWLRLMSHEIHLLGDCFPFIEVSCEHCNGSGSNGDEVCEHEGGTIRRIVILNPDFVEVYTSPLNPDPVIALKPDEELMNMVQRRTPGYERLAPKVRQLVAGGEPIRLDNRSVSHLKYGEGGYSRYGIGMVRRLFPVLSYKTKLMVAQWIVAERLIVPIKVVKVGSDERPAGPADIAAVQSQLAQTANDPNLTLVTHHAFELDWIGASGKVLTLSNEFDFINQEILDGMMINNALLNGEGPTFANASVGIEAMIQRLETFRREISEWIEEEIYLPESMRQGFVEIDEDTGEEEYIYPEVKWNSMHLRDQQQYRTFMMQLYEKGLLSAQTVLESFDLDPDREIERKRYDALQQMAVSKGVGELGGGFGGGDAGGGGMGDLGGMGGGMGGDMGGMGGGMDGGMGGDMGAPITPGGDMGAPMMASTTSNISVESSTPYNGKILKQKTRDKIDSQQKKLYKSKAQGEFNTDQTRDEKGRIIFTSIERKLIPRLQKCQSEGLIRYQIVPQYKVQYGSNREYSIDFGVPALKIAIEADGETFHGSEKQITSDKERDQKLHQLGWTVLRFTDADIDKKLEKVISTIVKAIMEKEMFLKQEIPSSPS